MAQRLTPDMIKRAGYGMDHPDYQGSPDEKSWFEHSYMPRLAARGEEVPEGYELVLAMQDVKLDRKWGFFDVNGDFRQMAIGMSYRVMPYNYIVCQAKNPPAPLVVRWSCRHKRLPEDSRCPVCAGWSGRIVTT